ncbi:MAG: hypothetical protein ACOX5R_20635 [bacterium]
MEKLHLKQDYAHTASKLDPEGPWQLLSRHLQNVAGLAGFFAQAAKPDDNQFITTAHLAGLLHDLGKYRKIFI